MMKNIEPKILKGFRDFLPSEARKRQYAINILKQVFESYGFEPLETPALEYEEILLGKYGDEGDKLMYRFEDNGKRRVALRYDQTVPLARVVAQYGSTSSPQGQNLLPMPFKRYQIQNVWRAENTQKGRFREFLQCDADIVGSSSPLSDAEVISLAAISLKKLGFSKFKILVNYRDLLNDIPKNAIATIDKLKKIGKENVLKELIRKGFSDKQSLSILDNIESKAQNEKIKERIGHLISAGLDVPCEYSPSLVRGLDYYTGMIFEIEINGYSAGSVCGGGRYDNLIGLFTNKQIPAVGFAFGFDRLMEAMEELNLFPKDLQTTKVLITIFPDSPKLKDKSLEITQMLRDKNINAELYLDENTKLDKQLKYADQKGIAYVVIIGPNELTNNQLTIRNMQTREQKTFTPKDLLNELV